MILFKRLTSLIGLFTFTTLSASLMANTLSVEVHNLTPDQGEIRVAIFDNEQQFPNQTFVYNAVESVKGTSQTLTINNIESGHYALSMFQDLNGNKLLDTGIFSIPKEPYGFSGEWKSGAASFEEATIHINKDMHITINMK